MSPKSRPTVSQWVREAIRSARSRHPVKDTGPKLAAVREAARHTYPTGDIDEMLLDIERGYTGPEGGEPR